MYSESDSLVTRKKIIQMFFCGFFTAGIKRQLDVSILEQKHKSNMHISFKVNGKETIVTLTDVRPIFVICIDCIYCLHKTYIGRIVQW